MSRVIAAAGRAVQIHAATSWGYAITGKRYNGAEGPLSAGKIEECGDMDKDALEAWALANGWRVIAGHPSLTKPSSPKEAIVRIVFKATVVNVEAKKPAGKWEKVAGAPYGAIEATPTMGCPAASASRRFRASACSCRTTGIASCSSG